LWASAFVLPLASYFGYIGFKSLNAYDGRCMGLLDAQGPICTRTEYVLDYLFNGFTGGFVILIIVGWGLAIAVAAILVRVVRATSCLFRNITNRSMHDRV
jgi:hypothetical protein